MSDEPRRITRTGSPSWEPVTLSEAKTHLAIADVDDAHDVYIAGIIKGAREVVEHDCQVALATGAHTLTLDDFDDEDEIYLPIKPVTAITSITYIDAAGATQTWSSAYYVLDNNTPTPAVRLAYNASWPTTRGEPNAVTITFVAGHATRAAVPQSYKQMMLLEIARQFGDREGAETLPENAAYERIRARLERSTYP